MDFYTPPRTGTPAFRGPATTLDEMWDVSWRGQKNIENANAMWLQLNDEVDARNDAIAKAGGPQLRNPLRDETTMEDRQALKRMVDADNGSVAWAQFLRLSRYEQELADLEKSKPELAEIIRATTPPSLVIAKRMHEIEKQREEAYRDRGMLTFDFPGSSLITGPINMLRDPAGMAYIMGGALQAQVTSPADIMAILAGNIATSPAKSLLNNAFRNAIANAGSQAFLEPQVQTQRAMAGLEAGIGPAMENIVGAAGMGAALDVGIRAPIRAFNVSRGKPGPYGGWLRDAPDPAAPRVEPAETPEPQATPAQPIDLTIDPELRARAEAGDLAAMREIVDKVDALKEDPLVRGALAKAEAEEIAPVRIDGTPEPDADRVMLQVLRASMDPDEPAPRVPDVVPEAANPLDAERGARLYDDYAGPLDRLMRAAEDRLNQVDPRLVQRIDRAIEAGIGEVLEFVEAAVKKIDAGAKEEAVAQAFVRDVLSLANTGGLDRLNAIADMHSGLADPMELARAMRAYPDIIDSNIPDIESVTLARSLAALSEDAFAKVEHGEASALAGQVVSDHVADPSLHASILDTVTRAGLNDPDLIRRAIPDLLPVDKDLSLGPLDAGSTMDDPMGSEAKAQTERLKASLAEEIGQAQQTLAARQAQEQAAAQAEAERVAMVERAEEVRAAIAGTMGIVPSDYRVKVFSSFGDLPEGAAAEVMRANAKAFADALQAFQSAATEEARLAARAALDAAKAGRFVDAFTAEDTIWIGAHAMNPQGRMAHEVVHALVASGRLTRDELALLADAGRRSNAITPDREAIYRDTYGQRNVSPERLAEMLDEEAAAHLVEAWDRVKPMLERSAESAPIPVESTRIDGIVARLQAFFGSVREAIQRVMGREAKPNSVTEQPNSGSAKPNSDSANPVTTLLDAILSGEIAKREGIARVMRQEDVSAVAVRGAEPPARATESFSDPVTGDAYTRQEIDSIVDMWTYVQEARSAKPPETLTSWLKSIGGLNDDHAEVRNILGRAKDRPGLINKNGVDLDDAALMAWEQGFFRTKDRPTISEFLDAIDEDFRGNQVIRAADEQRADDIRVAREMERELASLGIDGLTSADAVRAYFASPARESGTGARRSPPDVERAIAEDIPFAIADTESKAKAQRAGFDVSRVWYHATGQSFDAFDPRGVLDDRAGRDPYYAQAPRMVFMASKPDLTTLWSGGEGGRVLPLYTKNDLKLFQGARDADALRAFVSENDAAIRERLFNRVDEPDLVAAVRRGDWEILETLPVQEWLRANGYDGFLAKSGTTDIQAIFDTANDRGAIRSINAAFDPAQSASPNLMYAIRDAETGRDMRRAVDALGYYSKLDEVLGSLNPKDKVTIDTLLQKGVKKSEIEARGLMELFGSRERRDNGAVNEASAPRQGDRTDSASARDTQMNQSVPVSSLIETAGRNRVEVREVQNVKSPNLPVEARPNQQDAAITDIIIGGEAAGQVYKDGSRYRLDLEDGRSYQVDTMDQALTVVRQRDPAFKDQTKWSSLSLDPSNPSYRETVLHLPLAGVDELSQQLYGKPYANLDNYERMNIDGRAAAFQQHHFSDVPNVIGHMMTSMVKHEGRPVYLIDQIQSDWGQKIRDGGVRDEAKTAELKNAAVEARGTADALLHDIARRTGGSGSVRRILDEAGNIARSTNDADLLKTISDAERAVSEQRRIEAEYQTVLTSVAGNPLVNTTDQWVNTTLRRAIRQAAEADAAYIAIPHGDTVLSYNPEGSEGPNGMREFYGRSTKEGIVPKNLRKLIEKIDKTAAKPIEVKQVEAPSKGMTNRGDIKISDGGSDFGFTIFPLTDKLKQEVMQRGQVMFAFAGEKAKTADLEALSRAKLMEMEGTDRTKIWTDTGWFRGVDGKWKWEIDDSGAKWARPISEWLAGGMAPRFGIGYARAQAASATNTVNTMQMLRHPELYSAYPSIAYQPLGVVKGDGPLGMAGRTQDGQSFAAIHESAQPMPAKGALMHEVAGHGVQHQEGFAAGGNKAMFSADEIAAEQQRMSSAAADDGWSTIGTAAPDDPVSAAQRLYMRLAGEVEARAVQKRMDMTPEQRRSRPPWLDYDVPEDQQIVRFADGSSGPMFAIRDLAERNDAADIASLKSATSPLPPRLLAFHSTAKPFDAMAPDAGPDLGLHFGRLDVSSTFHGTRYDWNERMYPVVIDTSGIVPVDSKAQFTVQARGVDVVEAIEAGHIPSITPDLDGFAAVKAAVDPVKAMPRGKRTAADMQAVNATVRDWLLSHGVWGFVYNNTMDGPGVSVMAWRGVESATDRTTMFAIRDDATPDRAGMLARLTEALSPLAETARQAGVAIERDADGTITAVTRDGTRYTVERDQVGAIVGMIPALDLAPQLATLRDAAIRSAAETAQSYGITLDEARIKAITDEVTGIMIEAPRDPEAAAAKLTDLVQRTLDDYMPQREAAAANDNMAPLGPETPLERDLAEIQKMTEMMDIVVACRVA